MTIKPYKKRGQTCYKFSCYVGIDPKTGKEKHTTRRGFKTKKEAQIAYSMLFEKSNNARKRYKDVYADWLTTYEHTVKESTLQKTKRLFTSHILPTFGEYYIDAITLDDVQKAVNAWAKKYDNASVFRSYTSNIFDEAIRKKLITSNPCKLIVMPKREQKQKAENFYDKEELKHFLEATEVLGLEWQTFFRLLAFTGLRKGEALALMWTDIHGNKLSITKTLANGEGGRVIVQTPKTEDSERVIDIDSTTLTMLENWRELQTKLFGKTDIIFTNINGERSVPSKPGYLLDKLYRHRPMKRISTHGLRHTHCSMLFESGATLAEVQKRLGHKDVHTTMNIYNHVSKQKKQEAVDRLTQYLGF